MGIFKAWYRRRHLEDVLNDEVEQHIEFQTEEYIRSGLTPEEARIKARKLFGHTELIKEYCRDQNKTAFVESLWQDLRFAARSLRSQPAFTAALLLTLMLGIGANTAVFSVLRAVLLEPLPIREPGQVAIVYENDRLRHSLYEFASFPDYLDLKESAHTFESLAATTPSDVTITGRGEADRVLALRVSSNFFQVAGLDPELGRAFRKDEPGAVLSHSLWVEKFGGSPTILGAPVVLDGVTYPILGVMPALANALSSRDIRIWVAMEPIQGPQFRGRHGTLVYGRLRPGITMIQAQTEVSSIMDRLERQFPDDNLGRGAQVVPLHDELAGTMKPALAALSVAVVVLLLAACVNIANLLIAKASARAHEMAVRASLGAAKSRLVRQLITESLLVALLGATLGVGLAALGIRGLIALAPPNTALIGRATLDIPVLTTTLLITVAAWLLFGLLPAIQASRSSAKGALSGAQRHTPTRTSLRIRHALLVCQVAIAAILLFSAAVLVRSFRRLQEVDLGYSPQGMAALQVKLPEKRYPFAGRFPMREWPVVTSFTDRLKAAAQAIPGAGVVSIAMASPDHALWTTRVTVVGRPVPPEGEQDEAQHHTADPDYLQATHARLIRGRFFTAADDPRHPMVAVVNEEFARRHFPNEDPIGQSINVFGIHREVVGLLANIRYGGPDSPQAPAMYFPVAQAPFSDVTLIVRTSGDPASLLPAMRQAVLSADPDVAPFDVTTLQTSLSNSMARERFILGLLTTFAALALALAAVGIYGVAAFAVALRRQEIALHLALGAPARTIAGSIIRGLLVRTCLGVAAGFVVSLFAARVLQPLVFETSTHDRIAYLVALASLIAIAALGAALPAIRASRLSPSAILREL